MLIRTSHRRPHGYRYFILCLMMFVLSLRALVPAGFMPDGGALRDGRLEMAFCSADGSNLKTVVIDRHGAPAPQSPQSPDGGHLRQAPDCPFNLLTSLPLLPTMAFLLAGMPLPAWIVPPAARPAMPALVSLQGPPLGSRAPPLL
jgi:hypothetical protein